MLNNKLDIFINHKFINKNILVVMYMILLFNYI